MILYSNWAFSLENLKIINKNRILLNYFRLEPALFFIKYSYNVVVKNITSRLYLQVIENLIT